mmetsp:Transcript_4276/g.4697  ORF Transcript_4276/g.4697 Transcript_4276/m.4697 type:complete len:455 (-) Transcript_4276:1749-3113(-)
MVRRQSVNASIILLFLRCPRKNIKTSHINLARGISNKHDSDNENVLLADALNLLSPRTEVKNTINYKPSLFTNLIAKDSLSDEKIEPYLNYKLPNSDTKRHLDQLLAGLNIASQTSDSLAKSNYHLLTSSYKDLRKYINSLDNERSLIELVKLFYSQNELSSRLLTDVLLNKHLVNLDKFPFDINKMNPNDFKNWQKINFIQIKVVLLKKYYDLKKPLLIIKNLKENFMQVYLPMIRLGELTPFYERIIWKFYFEYILPLKLYISHNEAYFIKLLNSIKSTFIIWESSLMNNGEIAKFALKYHESALTPLQKSFLKLCSIKLTQNIITSELSQYKEYPKSKLLSLLKKLSIKHKIYSFTTTSATLPIETKSNFYALIHTLEKLILDELASVQSISSPEDQLELTKVLKEIKDFKESELMKLDNSSEFGLNESLLGGRDWDRFFLIMDRWHKKLD